MGGIHTQLATLISTLSDQRSSDNDAVGNRISGLETQLTQVTGAITTMSERFEQLMTVVTAMTATKGQGKGGPYGKDAGQGQGKAKTLIQVPDTTNDTAMDTNNDQTAQQPQTKSAKVAEA